MQTSESARKLPTITGKTQSCAAENSEAPTHTGEVHIHAYRKLEKVGTYC